MSVRRKHCNIVRLGPNRIPENLMRALLLVLTICFGFTCVGFAATQSQSPQNGRYREWVETMKVAPRGPFLRIRWFCNDGTILAPEAYACEPHGGGSQHGEWTDQTKQLRADGFYVANILADLDEQALLASPRGSDEFHQILIEQFLIGIDDGWILRQARFYRGALQEEGERAGARRLLQTLAGDPRWIDQGYAALRIGARLLRHGAETASVTDIRQLSANLSRLDPDFGRVRNKIHVRPDGSDAASVRAYAGKVTDESLLPQYEELAALIDEVYSGNTVISQLQALADESSEVESLSRLAREGARALAEAETPGRRFRTTGELLAALRDGLSRAPTGSLRLLVLDTSLAVEDEHFALATKLKSLVGQSARRTRLEWLDASIQAIYGAGLIRARQQQALSNRLATLLGPDTPEVELTHYKGTLDYLGLAPAWASQRLRFHFFEAMEHLKPIEPLAELFIQDQLRGSPLFFYADVLDGVLRDANHLAGVSHELFGDNLGTGLRALNPGLARGRLYLGESKSIESYHSDGIYLLPETVSDLPPIAGILTAGEGNPLSHVQLLARNLGIPNVGVDTRLSPKLEAMEGKPVILAVSRAGSVRLTLDEGQWDDVFGQEEKLDRGALIKPDLAKLDLSVTSFVTLSELRATDSGRIVGPKAAKLGELHHHYPEAVAEGLTIPFGVFRNLLDQPHEGSGQSIYAWMVENYRRLEQLAPKSDERKEQTEQFREKLYQIILHLDPGDTFRARLREAMQVAFGEDGSYGVFVRSDTNVEDLPGFTGAGLNLTVVNEVGVDNIIAAIPRVWASPFTARAFAWRQSHMDQPEHVYPAVLLMRSVPAEKSGVLVTRDIDSGAVNGLSVAVNEGVGGAVDGQAAESLRINTDTGEVKLLAQATTPVRRRINPLGGVDKVPVSGSDSVLLAGEIADLIELSRELPARFPSIVDAAGNPAPADIEFGFLAGELKLFQIRPFLESAQARSSEYLKTLDSGLVDLSALKVDLSAIPE